ncbi:hypothetical protein ABZX66_21020 [Micromonospora aurantiaca]|uniref:hypothetical protein n=1 Tax=Micromonospora aurantiaca (nom. illeg.) TaxID=47850 RepID=UPI0033AD1469
MTIMASAPVPPASRLIDADTADIAAIRKADTNQGRFPMNKSYVGRAAVPVEPSAEVLKLGRRAWELSRTSPTPLSDKQLAVRLGTSVTAIEESVLAYLRSSADLAASVQMGRSVDARLEADPHATTAEVAADLGITIDEALDARHNLICWEEGATRLIRIPEAVEGRTNFLGRPLVRCGVDWCTGNCTFDDDFGKGEFSHNRTIVDDQVADGSSIGESRRLLVQLQEFHSPLLNDNEEPSVYLSTGDTDEYGAKLTLDEAERMALAILAGVRAVRQARD